MTSPSQGVAVERRVQAPQGRFWQQIREPDAQDGRLQFVETAVHAGHGVQVAVGLAAVAEQAHAIGQGAVARDHGPAVSRSAPRFLVG